MEKGEDLMKNNVEAMIEKLNHQTNSYLYELKTVINELNKSNGMNIISYFTYSLNISHNTEQESICLGSYHIHNLGSKAITNPYLCISIPKESPFTFSGQYVYGHLRQSMKSTGEWERINDKKSKEEFWLKPLTKEEIEPNETLSFSNFQIKWAHTESYAGSITAITYSDQLKDGIAVINPININGTISIPGDEDE